MTVPYFRQRTIFSTFFLIFLNILFFNKINAQSKTNTKIKPKINGVTKTPPKLQNVPPKAIVKPLVPKPQTVVTDDDTPPQYLDIQTPKGAMSVAEMRGVWVSTIQNVDFPTRPSTNPEVLKKDWLDNLTFFKSLNLNCVIVQIRPSADAIYPSKLVPYSKFLTGKSGKAPEQKFDMLQFMIETSHAQGFEFHAWVNPFRAVLDKEGKDTVSLHPSHVMKAHRDWIFKYGNEWLLNPGIPAVRAHFVAVVEEVVKNYDVDAIHFDDYFYPYRIHNEKLPDENTFKKYGGDFTNIDDWRRANINEMMQKINQVTKQHKPNCQIGVSPFSVWRNKKDDPRGSDTRAGQRCYDDLYADVLAWLENDWIDYVTPEVYFHFGFELADYEKIVNWWVKNTPLSKRLYIGHAVYKVNNNQYTQWSEPDQISRQVHFNRTIPTIKGSMFFSSKWLRNNQLGVTDRMKDELFVRPARIPK